VRTLANELRVNPNTVQHAYRTLEQDGLVEVRRGLGTFVSQALKSRDTTARQATLARQIAERMLREAYRHGLLASDVMTALKEIAPRRGGGASGPGGQE
jgi:GntR family transcriptional regulator